MKALLTNTLNQPISLFYRLPASKEREQSILIEVALPPRALAHEVTFASEEHFEAFKHQNVLMLESEKIIIGKVNEKKAEKTSADNAAKSKETIKKQKDAVIKTFEKTADGTNASMKFKVEGAK